MLTNIKNHISNIALVALVVLCLAANISSALDAVQAEEVVHGSH